MKNHRVFDVFINYFLGGAQRAPKIDFGRVWGPFESPLGTSFGHVGGSVELLGHHLGPKWSQKRQHEGLKSDLGSSRGGQGVPEARNGSILGRFSSFAVCYLVFWYVFCKKGLVHTLLQRCCVFVEVVFHIHHFFHYILYMLACGEMVRASVWSVVIALVC